MVSCLSQLRPFLLPLFSLLPLLPHVLGDSVNITVDDQKGDSRTGAVPSYAPSNVWNSGPQCTTCLVQPNPSEAFDSTWHDSTIAPGDTPYTVTYSFTGSKLNDARTVLLTLSYRDSYLRFFHSGKPSPIRHDIFKSFFYS